jgi:anti-sigma regulatory factor (Ser/Thr protein kinase)
METSVTFPGVVAIVPAARLFVRGILADSPRAGDAELIAAELVTNAIRHTPSGEAGGEFTVSIWSKPGWARIEVADEGAGQWSPLPGESEDEYGRGLAIVAALAERFGHDVNAGGAQTVWAEITWPEMGGYE